MTLLGRVFNIHPHEWRRFLTLYGTALLFFTGITWGETLIEASFLKMLGVQYLPLVFALHAVIQIVLTAGYVAVVDRLPNNLLLILIVMGSVLAVAACILLLEAGQTEAAFLMLYVLVRIVRAIFTLHWWTYVSDFYDIQESKRIVPVLSSVVRVGMIIAGFTMPLLTRLFLPLGIVIVWMISLTVLALVVWATRRWGRSSPASQPTANKAITGNYFEHLRQGYFAVSQSPFLRWMSISTLVMVLIFAILNYQPSHTMIGNFQTTAEMSNYIGLLNGLSSLILLPLQIFLFNRLVGRVGIGIVNFIFPAITLLVSMLLLGFPTDLSIAGLAYVNRTSLRLAVREPSNNLLLNAIPGRVKGRARAFIDGFVVPIGLLLSAALLLIIPLIPEETRNPALLISLFVLAIGYVASAWFIRQLYSSALIDVLEQDGISSLLSLGGNERLASSAGVIQWLKTQLAAATNDDMLSFLSKMAAEFGGNDALPLLSEVAARPNVLLRLAVLDAVIEARLRGDSVQQFLTHFINDPDWRVRKLAISGLEQITGHDNKVFANLAYSLLEDPSDEVRAQVIRPLLRSRDTFFAVSAAPMLWQLLHDESPERQIVGIDTLAQTREPRFLQLLFPYLSAENDTLRVQAMQAVYTLSQPDMSDALKQQVIDYLQPASQDPLEKMRELSLTTLGRLRVANTYSLLIDALTDPNRRIRQTAVDTLVSLDKPIIPLLNTLDSSGTQTASKMVSVILARIQGGQFNAQIENHINNNLLDIYRNHARLNVLLPYVEYSGMALVCQMLVEENTELIEDIFYLLTAIRDRDKVQVIAESFRAESTRLRANALEAFSAMTSSGTATLFAPLFDKREAKALVEIGQRQLDFAAPNAVDSLRELLVSARDNHWRFSLIIYALAQLDALKPRQVRWHTQIPELLTAALTDAPEDIQEIARRFKTPKEEQTTMLSVIEKVIFLKEVSFFQNMTVEQLRVLAAVSEEQEVPENTVIFREEDLGGAMYVIVRGKVGIERTSARGSSTSRLATLQERQYFGEMTVFNNRLRDSSAIAIADTMVLILRREPLLALIRQYPDLSLELIRVLSDRLLETNDQVASLTKARPRELHKLFDSL